MPYVNVLDEKETIFKIEYSVAVGAAMVWVVATSQMFGGYYVQSPAANGDRLDVRVALRAGTQYIRTLYLKNSNGGQVALELDGNYIGLRDCYNNPIQYNQIAINSFTPLAEDGVHTFSLHVTGKAAASSGYINFVQMVQFLTEV